MLRWRQTASCGCERRGAAGAASTSEPWACRRHIARCAHVCVLSMQQQLRAGRQCWVESTAHNRWTIDTRQQSVRPAMSAAMARQVADRRHAAHTQNTSTQNRQEQTGIQHAGFRASGQDKHKKQGVARHHAPVPLSLLSHPAPTRSPLGVPFLTSCSSIGPIMR